MTSYAKSAEAQAGGGGMGASKGITDKSIGRGQTIKSAYPMDNQDCMPLPDTKGGKMAGGIENLSHSLTGASAVAADVGAKGPVKHVIFRDH